MKIEVKNLEKKFKGIEILNNINVTFEEGNIYGLVGRNGSGKSVFLKILCAFYKPSSGEVLFDGKDIFSDNSFPPSTRALIEKPNFLPDVTGYNNLKLLADIQGQIGKEEIEEALIRVNLFSEKDKKFSKYSLGMKQKLGIAQVLMEDPKVMVLDEPFNGIEDETAKKIRTHLTQEKKKGKIIIIATHIKDDIEELADILYRFDGGTVKLLDKKD